MSGQKETDQTNVIDELIFRMCKDLPLVCQKTDVTFKVDILGKFVETCYKEDKTDPLRFLLLPSFA